MRWTAEGLEAILQLRLVKYADPEYYQAFLDELLQRSTKTAINCDLSIESTSGKVRPLCNTTKSLSVAILEETSEVDSFNEDELAEMFDVGSEIILEHLGHLRKGGH